MHIKYISDWSNSYFNPPWHHFLLTSREPRLSNCHTLLLIGPFFYPVLWSPFLFYSTLDNAGSLWYTSYSRHRYCTSYALLFFFLSFIMSCDYSRLCFLSFPFSSNSSNQINTSTLQIICSYTYCIISTNVYHNTLI